MSRNYSLIANLLVKWRYVLLLIALLLLLASVWFGKPMTFDRSIESMFRADDKLLVDFEKLKRVFAGNEILMVAYRDEQLFNADRQGIRRLEKIGQRLKSIEGVSDVMSLAEINRMLSRVPDPRKQFAQRITNLFAGYTHSEDGTVAAVICMLEPLSPTAVPREQVIANIRSEMVRLRGEDQQIPQSMLIGEPVMIADSFEMIDEDGVRLRWSSAILLVLTIFVFFRSIRWMLIPVAVVQFAMLLTESVLAWSNLRLTMVSSMMDAIVTVIGVATTVHIIVIYRQSRRAGQDRQASMTESFRLLIAPIFWAIATDAAGFMSLYFSQLGPVRDFAVMMVTGTIMVLVSTVLLVPALSLLPLPKALRFIDNDPVGQRPKSFLDQHLQHPLSLGRKHPLLMIGLIFVVSLFMVWGLVFSEVESDFTKNFRRESEIVQSYEFVESNLGGAGVWDVMIPAPRTLTFDYLSHIDRLEQRLRSEVLIETNIGLEPGLSKVISLGDVISSIVNAESMPLLRDALVPVIVTGMKIAMPGYLNATFSSDPNEPNQFYLRIMLRSKERRSAAEKKMVIARTRAICTEELQLTEFANQPVVVTGYYVLLANMIDSIIRDQWLTFGIAICGIFIMLVVATRSLRYALISLVPNVVPILMVLGLLGWLDQKVNIGVAMIAAVSIGMSVDSSIHYIFSFQRAVKSGSTMNEALDEVQNRVGRALVFSTIAIILGFATLCISNFIPIVYFGVLSIMAMVGGLVGNLVVLPLLLQTFRPRVIS